MLDFDILVCKCLNTVISIGNVRCVYACSAICIINVNNKLKTTNILSLHTRIWIANADLSALVNITCEQQV